MLPDKDRQIDEFEGKLILKLFKRIAGGCRSLLRLAAETQLGPLGVNYRQSTITDFFKPNAPLVRVKSATTGGAVFVKKNRKEIIYLNKNLKPCDIFYTTPSNVDNIDVLYWEFKAG